MNKIRVWLIHKLGGIVLGDIKYREVVNDYWDKVYATASIYVSPENYTKKHAGPIEHELAHLLAEELLRKDCVFFHGPYKDHGDLHIIAGCNVLKLHERESYNSPNHLVFKEAPNEST